MSQPVWEPQTHTRTCPWWTHGGICDCGVLDPQLWDVTLTFVELVAEIHDYVWEGDE